MGLLRELKGAFGDVFGKEKDFTGPWVGHPLLNRLGLHGAPIVIIADLRGFHRRGPGRPGAARLALYANLRTRPFSPLAY